MEHMSTLDAGFFFAEHTNVPMHLGALAVFEGPVPSYQELVDLYSSKLSKVPRYRQVVRTAPLNVFDPVWADDEDFDIGNHLRRAVIDAPGRARQVHDLAGRIYAQPLDRGRPLWEAWLLEGVEHGRWAILSKVHHAMADGIAGVDLMTEVFDVHPEGQLHVEPESWAPRPQPSLASTLTSGIRGAVTSPWRLVFGAPAFVRGRLAVGTNLAGFVRGLAGAALRMTVPSASCLNGPIGPERRWTWTTVSLNKVKQIRAEFGTTVNDVLLAAVTCGFRDLLIAHGELSDGLVVRSLVPISIRCEEEQGVVSNRLSAVLANLPVAVSDPVRRLLLVSEEMDDIKRSQQTVGTELLTRMLGVAPASVLSLGARAVFQLPQPLVQTMTTNVPGPQIPLYILGRRMVAAHPYAPIGDNVRIAVAIFSYLGKLSFGITADASAAPDIEILARGIRRGLSELHPTNGHRASSGSRK